MIDCTKKISCSDAVRMGMSRYFTGKPCKNGHISERFTSNRTCCECTETRNKSDDYKEKEKNRKLTHYSEFKDEIRRKDRERYSKRKDTVNEKRRKKRADNAATMNEKQRVYRRNNKRRDEFPNFIRRTLRRIEGSKTKETQVKYQSVLGYSKEEFIHHIESQFEEGMSWSNRAEWHIDHITPIKWFLSQGITDVKVINSLSNLQPLWAIDNLSKGSVKR